MSRGVRLNPKHDEATRAKIKTSQIINRLNAFTLSETDPQTGEVVMMSPAQVKAATTLLDRVLPRLQSVEGGMDLTIRSHEQALRELAGQTDEPELEASDEDSPTE